MFLQHISQVTDIEGIPVILPWRKKQHLVSKIKVIFSNCLSTLNRWYLLVPYLLRAWDIYRHGWLLDLLLNNIFGRKAFLQEREFHLCVHCHTNSFDWFLSREESMYWLLKTVKFYLFQLQINVKQRPKWYPYQKEMWCSLLPQEYKAQGGSPVKLKPFKYDSRPGPAE